MEEIVCDVKDKGYVEILYYCCCYLSDINLRNFNLCLFVECIVINILI